MYFWSYCGLDFFPCHIIIPASMNQTSLNFTFNLDDIPGYYRSLRVYLFNGGNPTLWQFYLCTFLVAFFLRFFDNVYYL